MRRQVGDALQRGFRPEFLNRIDDTIVFPQLTEAQVLAIVDLMMARIDGQLRHRDMSVSLTDAAKLYLARQGFDPALGARPLRRTIQREVEDALAERILFNELRPGQRIVIDAGDDGLVYASPPPEACTIPAGRVRRGPG